MTCHNARLCSAVLTILCLATTSSIAQSIRPPGQRPEPPALHALIGARVVPRPGEEIDSGVVIISDGLIAAVGGADLEIPAGARVWKLEGSTIYAGLIDARLDLSAKQDRGARRAADPHSSRDLDRELRAGFLGVVGDERDPGSPGPGSAIRRIEPQRRVVESLSPDPERLRELRELGFTAGLAVPTEGIFQGTSAFVVLADDDPSRVVLEPDVFQHVSLEVERGGERVYPASLMGTIAAVRQTFMDAAYHQLDLADHAARSTERRRPDHDPALEALARAAAGNQRVCMEVTGVLGYDQATQIASELGLDLVLVATGEEWRRPDIVAHRHWPMVVPIDFPELPRLPEESDWVQVGLDPLRRWDWAPENPRLLRDLGVDFALTSGRLDDTGKLRKNLALAIARGLTEQDALAALTTVPARLCGVDDRLGTIAPGKLANLTIVAGTSWFDAEARVEAVWIDGVHLPSRPAKEKPEEEAEAEQEDEEEVGNDDEEPTSPRHTLTARSPLSGRGPYAGPRALLIRDATVWTCSSLGRIEDCDVLVHGGRIRAIGPDLELPAELGDDTFIVEAAGLHVTPGLIDCHSHGMITGGVNEGTLPSTAMVRIGDVVDCDSANIRRQLAGGLTVANLLHGSANPIGGQNAVIKLRDGRRPEHLLLDGAPAGIKFALGENVKQSNWGDRNTTRFPQTRMGVKTFFANRFETARQYLHDIEVARVMGTLPPRRDLELEALGEILRGERLIHCHSYRQDEILMLMRLMESFDVRIGTFQHVLEGYKVADEIAAHGAGGSCFSDWWAYKFEVYDAIPYAGAIMHERDVVVSFNSDSADHARRLNTEAAKACRYGGLSEEDALALVTINPARQLGIDQRVGSLVPDKDGDLAIWSGPPLATSSVCLQTWIEGAQYHDRAGAAARAAARAAERDELLAKAQEHSKRGHGKDGDSDGDDGDEPEIWRRFFAASQDRQLDRGCCEDTHEHEEDGR